MVHNQFTLTKREAPSSRVSGVNYSIRCCHKSRVGLLHKRSHAQSTRPYRRGTSSVDLSKNTENKVTVYYLMKMGKTKSWGLIKISKMIWNYILDKKIILTTEWIPNWRLDRVEIFPIIISKKLQRNGDNQHRLLCISSFSSSSILHELKSRPMLSSGGCIPTRLESILPICIPSFLPPFEGPETTVQTKSGKSELVIQLSVTQPRYLFLLSMCIQNAMLITSRNNLL